MNPKDRCKFPKVIACRMTTSLFVKGNCSSAPFYEARQTAQFELSHPEGSDPQQLEWARSAASASSALKRPTARSNPVGFGENRIVRECYQGSIQNPRRRGSG